ncbi:hypothetical protein LOAG_08377 [Loa loa]|uniref:Uncharacterized protein n=1 Tax=Loa loa TaxID=7209 RepID=A0A1S0TU30_LOALO|nr:hypothetical protein LOAG_08377 [Loa loa]EFO20112.1 hypothetical protein LOAG_08377 [Loa loa]
MKTVSVIQSVAVPRQDLWGEGEEGDDIPRAESNQWMCEKESVKLALSNDDMPQKLSVNDSNSELSNCCWKRSRTIIIAVFKNDDLNSIKRPGYDKNACDFLLLTYITPGVMQCLRASYQGSTRNRDEDNT